MVATWLCALQLGCLDTAGVGECGFLNQSPRAPSLLLELGPSHGPCSPSLVSSLGLQPD